MAFYFIQGVIPGTELDLGIYVIYKQRCTYSCSSGSRQTSLTRNANIALAITPKSATPFSNHESTPPNPLQSWNVFLNPRLFQSQTPCPAAPSARSHRLPWWALASAAGVSVHGDTHPAAPITGLPGSAQHPGLAGSTAPSAPPKAFCVQGSSVRAPASQPGLKHPQQSS